MSPKSVNAVSHSGAHFEAQVAAGSAEFPVRRLGAAVPSQVVHPVFPDVRKGSHAAQGAGLGPSAFAS